MCNVHVWHDCRRMQYTPSPSLEIILPVKLFVLFGYPLRWVNIGTFPYPYWLGLLHKTLLKMHRMFRTNDFVRQKYNVVASTLYNARALENISCFLYALPGHIQQWYHDTLFFALNETLRRYCRWCICYSGIFTQWTTFNLRHRCIPWNNTVRIGDQSSSARQCFPWPL